MASRVKHGTTAYALVVGLLRLLLLLPVVEIMGVEAARREGVEPNSKQPCSLRDPAMDPTHEVRYGHDVVWQIPAEPKAVLFFAHGSGMESLQFFDPGPNCMDCYGLPECRTAVLQALQLGYAVIAVTGKDTSSQFISTILSEWMTHHSLDSLPLTAWGHSAGTDIVTALTRTLRIVVSVLMNGEGLLEVEALATPLSFPSTLFVYMPRDESVEELNKTNKDVLAMEILTARGVEVAKTPCFPKPLSPLFFTERILCMTPRMSKSIYAALKSEGWIGSQGYLVKNPAEEDLEYVLVRANALPFCAARGGLCLIEHVSQELNMAYGVHSFTSGANDVIFTWLDSHVASASSAKETEFQPPDLTVTI